jgi:hypothetical protein
MNSVQYDIQNLKETIRNIFRLTIYCNIPNNPKIDEICNTFDNLLDVITPKFMINSVVKTEQDLSPQVIVTKTCPPTLVIEERSELFESYGILPKIKVSQKVENLVPVHVKEKELECEMSVIYEANKKTELEINEEETVAKDEEVAEDDEEVVMDEEVAEDDEEVAEDDEEVEDEEVEDEEKIAEDKEVVMDEEVEDEEVEDEEVKDKEVEDEEEVSEDDEEVVMDEEVEDEEMEIVKLGKKRYHVGMKSRTVYIYIDEETAGDELGILQNGKIVPK